MDPFTIFLIIAGVVVVLGLGAWEIYTWRKPGRRGRQRGIMDDPAGYEALKYSQTNARNSDLGQGGNQI